MNDDLPGSDLMALRNKFKTAKPQRLGSGASRRAKIEARRTLSETDGRRKPAHEIRDTQMNIKITADTKRRIVGAANALGVSMVEVLERGLALIEAEIAKSEGN